MELEEDERRILEGKCSFNGGRNLILTNKRLIVMKKKGFFGKFDILDAEIPLTKIKQCTLNNQFWGGNSITLELKNGEKHIVDFFDKPEAALFGTNYDFTQSQNSEHDRWLLAINGALNATR